MKTLKIAATVIAIMIIATNLQQATVYYNIDRISLPDQFYWQSINDVVVDNKVNERQSVTISSSFKMPNQLLTTDNKKKILFITTRNSYHFDW